MARRNLRELMVTDGVEDDSFIMSDVDTPLPSTGPEDAVKYGTRIEGLDAPEISRILPTGEVTEPSPGGEVYNTLIQSLQRKHGFKNIEYIKNKDGEFFNCKKNDELCFAYFFPKVISKSSIDSANSMPFFPFSDSKNSNPKS